MSPQARSHRRSDAVKRVFDVVVASFMLVLLSPLLLALAVLVRVRLGPPVIFTQVRPGLGSRPFTIYKFRTMVGRTVDANGNELSSVERTPRWAHRMRSLSLDELPELWNVIKGDMSLVGPRPLLMEYVPRYSAEQARRHEVRPGITGLAQVSGRNALSWEQKFALDVAYVDKHDLQMDLDILLKTVSTVISRDGVRHTQSEDMPEFVGSDVPAAGSGHES